MNRCNVDGHESLSNLVIRVTTRDCFLQDSLQHVPLYDDEDRVSDPEIQGDEIKGVSHRLSRVVVSIQLHLCPSFINERFEMCHGLANGPPCSTEEARYIAGRNELIQDLQYTYTYSQLQRSRHQTKHVDILKDVYCKLDGQVQVVVIATYTPYCKPCSAAGGAAYTEEGQRILGCSHVQLSFAMPA